MSHGGEILAANPVENHNFKTDTVLTSHVLDRPRRGSDGGHNYKGQSHGIVNGGSGDVVQATLAGRHYSAGRRTDSKNIVLNTNKYAGASKSSNLLENQRNISKTNASDHQNSQTEADNKQNVREHLSATDDIEPNDSASNANPKAHDIQLAEHKAKDNNNLKPDKENSFVKTVKKEATKVEGGSSQVGTTRPRRKMKKGIFVSYSPDAGYMERKFVLETVRQLKENNLSEDIWFDKDENNTDNPCWFSLRMEAVERCRAAILFLSDSYFTCPVSVYEGKALLERQKVDQSSVKICIILYSQSEEMEIPKSYNHLLQDMVDLTNEHASKSLAEKTSVVVGSLMMDLEKHASIHAAPPPFSPPDVENNNEYKKKKICQWGANDLQEWLFKLGIKEFYRQSLAENMVDGFLLMSITDQDMVQHLGIDSRAVRKKIMQQILVTLDKEHKLQDNWHLRARTQRARPNSVYLVYDPADVRLAQNLKHDLTRKNVQVTNHQKLGQSKEEFLQLNGPQMATTTYVLVVLTDAATNSPFVFHEVLFADWLGKKLVTAMFKNTWPNLRPSMKAVLGDCPAVDFEAKMYQESMDILEHHIKPLRTIPGVVLEQSYLNKMAEGLKPLAILCSGHALGDWVPEGKEQKVFISYQWDMQSKVEDIKRILEVNSFSCWVDINPSMSMVGGRQHSSVSNRSHVSQSSSHGSHVSMDSGQETLQSQIQRNMKAASVVLCCITPKYMQSDNCVKDLTLAETLHKPIIPLMLRFCPWPPEGAPSQVRKILVKHTPIDISNDKLFKQNVHLLIEKIKKLIGLK